PGHKRAGSEGSDAPPRRWQQHRLDGRPRYEPGGLMDQRQMQGLPSHPVISDPMIRTGGGGDAHNWPAILAGMSEVREASKRFLDSKPEPDLDRTIPYDGAIDYLHPIGLSLRYALMRVAAHHFVHVGEIVTIRY